MATLVYKPKHTIAKLKQFALKQTITTRIMTLKIISVSQQVYELRYYTCTTIIAKNKSLIQKWGPITHMEEEYEQGRNS